jgi:poly-gamma-glutamate capsule biosynthesis protein CapA/YwtB (metallophosphatase superfamily)
VSGHRYQAANSQQGLSRLPPGFAQLRLDFAQRTAADGLARKTINFEHVL